MKDINRLPEDRRADALEQYQMEQKARRESRLTHFDRFEGSIGSPDHKARERRMEAYKTRLKELTDAGALEKKEAKKMEQQERVIANEEAKVDAQAKQAERVAAFEEERNKIMRESSERTERIEQLKAEQAKREHQEKMSVAEERLLVLKESGTASQLKSATTEIEQLREGYLALNTGVEDKKDRTEIMAAQAMLQIDHHEDFNDFLSFGETDQRVVRRSAANIMGATKKNARDAMIEAIRAHKARLESTRRR